MEEPPGSRAPGGSAHRIGRGCSTEFKESLKFCARNIALMHRSMGRVDRTNDVHAYGARGPPSRRSVGDAEVLAVMGRGLDLVDNRGREVGAGDVGAAFGIEKCDLAAQTVRASALAGRPGAVRAGGA